MCVCAVQLLISRARPLEHAQRDGRHLGDRLLWMPTQVVASGQAATPWIVAKGVLAGRVRADCLQSMRRAGER